MTAFRTNTPLEEGQVYAVTKNLIVTLEGGREVWLGTNGLRAIGHCDAVGEYTLEIKDPGRLVYVPGTKPALFDAHFVPSEPQGLDFGRELDRIRDHHKEYTAGTGGEGRAYVNPASVILKTDPLAGWGYHRQALSALREWAIEELRARPLAHHPRIYTGDQYSQKTVNAGTEREWNHQKTNLWGWNAFDTAHLFLCYAYTLAAYGDPLGELYIALVYSWVVGSAYPGVCTNWITQPRGQGWVLELSAWAHVLRLFDNQAARDRFTCGFSTEEAAKLWLEHSNAEHLTRGIGDGDTHNSPKLRDANGKIVEVEEWRGHLAFHCAIRAWGLCRVVRSDLRSETRSLAREMLRDQLAYLETTAIDFGGGGMSRVIGTVAFPSRDAAEAEAARATAAEGKNPWEAFVFRRGLVDEHRIREVAHIPDSEMFWAAYAHGRGYDDHVETWLQNRDKARWDYDLAALAVKERAAAVTT